MSTRDPMEPPMHLSAKSVAEASMPAWRLAWQRALFILGAAWRRAMTPVAEGTCPGCEAERAQTRRWQERAGEWASDCLVHEQNVESLAAQLVAARKLLREARGEAPVTDADLAVLVAPGGRDESSFWRSVREAAAEVETWPDWKKTDFQTDPRVTDADLAAASGTLLTGQEPRYESAADASARRLDQQARARIGMRAPRFGSFTVPVVGEEEPVPEPRKLTYAEFIRGRGYRPVLVPMPDSLREAAKALAAPGGRPRPEARVNIPLAPLVQTKGALRMLDLRKHVEATGVAE